MRFRKTCAAVSAPRLVPQPNCVPWNQFVVGSVTKELTHFEQIRRSVFPTASGWTLSSFFGRSLRLSLAPKKNDLYPTRILQEIKTIFSTLVSFWRISLPMGPFLFAMRFFYNWGTSRLGPPDDPEGNELIAFAIVGSNTIKLSSTTCRA